MSHGGSAPQGDQPRASRIVSGSRGTEKYAVEAIGIFFLVFTVGATVGSASPFAPLAIGAVLMVMIYAGGLLCGGLYNPAVYWLGVARRRREGLFAWPTVWAYLLAQVVAGIAGLSFLALNPHDK